MDEAITKLAQMYKNLKEEMLSKVNNEFYENFFFFYMLFFYLINLLSKVDSSENFLMKFENLENLIKKKQYKEAFRITSSDLEFPKNASIPEINSNPSYQNLIQEISKDFVQISNVTLSNLLESYNCYDFNRKIVMICYISNGFLLVISGLLKLQNQIPLMGVIEVLFYFSIFYLYFSLHIRKFLNIFNENIILIKNRLDFNISTKKIKNGMIYSQLFYVGFSLVISYITLKAFGDSSQYIVFILIFTLGFVKVMFLFSNKNINIQFEEKLTYTADYHVNLYKNTIKIWFLIYLAICILILRASSGDILVISITIMVSGKIIDVLVQKQNFQLKKSEKVYSTEELNEITRNENFPKIFYSLIKQRDELYKISFSKYLKDLDFFIVLFAFTLHNDVKSLATAIFASLTLLIFSLSMIIRSSRKFKKEVSEKKYLYIYLILISIMWTFFLYLTAYKMILTNFT
jgi:hypothetical protein